MHVTRTTFAAMTVIAMTAAASAKPLTLPAETNLRAAPGTKSEILTLMPKGSEVEVGECDAGWCQVKFGDKDGFAIGRNLGEAAPQTAAAPRGQSQTDLSRLRRGYEQYFDGNNQNDVTGSVDEPQYSQNPQQQYAAPRNARPQYQQRQYEQRQYDNDYYDDEDDDDVVAYVPARPPVYYRYGPYPRAYNGWGPGPSYYYRRW